MAGTGGKRYGWHGEDAPGFPAWLRERGLGPGARVSVPSRLGGKVAVSGPIAERGGVTEYRLTAESLEAVREECRRLFGERRKKGIALRGRPLASVAAALAGGEDAEAPPRGLEGGGWLEGEPLLDGDLEESGLGEEI